MRVLRIIVAVSATLALLTAPASAAPGGDFVTGGGQRLLEGVPNRTFSVEARSLPGGGASGNYTFLSLSDPARPQYSFTARVTCVDVVGNHAVIGGTITMGNVDVGEDFLVFFIDNGDPVGGQIGPDIVSLTYVGAQIGGLLVLGADFPSDFPDSCPDANGATHANAEYRSVWGNIVVNDGS